MWHKKGVTDPWKYLSRPSAKVEEENKGHLKGMERTKKEAKEEKNED